jgi:hypothetical protein
MITEVEARQELMEIRKGMLAKCNDPLADIGTTIEWSIQRLALSSA